MADNEQNYLEMSDEELMQASLPTTEPAADTAAEEPVEPVQESAVEKTAAEVDPEPVDSGSEEAAEPAPTEGEPTEPETSGSTEPDYKAAYNQILAPFRANGKEIKVDSIEDAVTLMKMGANYNKKMAALKPNLKLLKMLENHGLLDESKLSYLIDLDKKNPEAIGKLVKDSGIDPLSLDPSEESTYTPKTYTVDDNQLALDAVLEEIRETPSYQTTLDVIGNKWDEASRRIIVANPAVIGVLNNQIASGIYDQIMATVDKQRMLGQLSGLSDLEAYRAVGDAMHAQGAFKPANPAVNTANNAPAVVTTPPTVSDKAPGQQQRDQRRRAASVAQGKPGAKPATDFNPLAMSDEEFDRITTSKYR